MKRYFLQINLGVSATSEEEAKRIVKEIVESGKAKGSTPTAIAYIDLTEDPIVMKELPF